MLELLILAAAGVIGSFLHAFVSKQHATLSRDTVGECFIGLLTGLLYPTLVGPLIAKVIDLPEAKDPMVAIVTKAAILGGAAFIAGDIIRERLTGLFQKLVGTPNAGKP